MPRPVAAVLAWVLLGAGVAMTACGASSDEDQIRELVAAVEEASKDKDLDRLCELQSANKAELGKCKRTYAALGNFEKVIGNVEALEVEGIAVKGGKATARVTATIDGETETNEAGFVKENGEWKLNARVRKRSGGTEEGRGARSARLSTSPGVRAR